VAVDGADGLAIAEGDHFDVLVLDVMLPKMNGLEIVRRLRQQRNTTPILLLTARDKTSDIVGGLDVGADDYLTKPFSLDVLLARVRALARRGPAERPPLLVVADLKLDPATHEAVRGGERLRLTRTEFALLETLMRRARPDRHTRSAARNRLGI